MGKTNFVLQLDQLRRERRVTVETMCKGVISRRNYSRLLSGEVEASLDTLSKLLVNLNVPLAEFSYYRFNHVMFENIDEVNFHEVMRYGNFSRAAKEFGDILNKHTLGSIYATKSVPIDVLILKHYLGLITKDDMVSQAKEIIQLPIMCKSYIIQDDDIDALYEYAKICREDDFPLIINFCERVIFTPQKFKMFTNYAEVTTNLLHLTLLQVLLRKNELSKAEHTLFKRVINSELEYIRRAKSLPFDILFFSLYKSYCEEYHVDNPYVTFYYYACTASTEHPDFVNRISELVSENDREVYLNCLKDESIRKGVLYEKVFFNEFL